MDVTDAPGSAVAALALGLLAIGAATLSLGEWGALPLILACGIGIAAFFASPLPARLFKARWDRDLRRRWLSWAALVALVPITIFLCILWGESLFARGDDASRKASIRLLRMGEMVGDSHSITDLGQIYYLGAGAPRSLDRAAKLFTRAATSGFDEGQAALGRIYLAGEGVKQDDSLGIYWLRKAADQENPSALADLGTAYSNGRGVNKDEMRALQYFEQAIAAGDAKANFGIGLIYQDGTLGSAEPEKARNYYRLAVEANSTRAAFNLAILLHDGIGGPADKKEAKRLMRIASSSDDAEIAKMARDILESTTGEQD